jgi:hypothetical protein
MLPAFLVAGQITMIGPNSPHSSPALPTAGLQYVAKPWQRCHLHAIPDHWAFSSPFAKLGLGRGFNWRLGFLNAMPPVFTLRGSYRPVKQDVVEDEEGSIDLDGLM